MSDSRGRHYQSIMVALLCLNFGTFPLFMATIPSETVDPRLTATVLGLIMGVGEGVGGVISPAIAGYAADVFGLEAPLWIMCGLPIVASLLALGLQETAPRRLAIRKHNALVNS